MKQKHNLVLLLLYVFLVIVRFVNIGLVPVFVDEAIYLEYGDKIVHNLNTVLLPITNANVYPVFPWLLALVNFTTGQFVNLLYSGRLLSLLADVGSSFLVYLIGKRLFDKKFGLLCSIVYLSLPLNFFHNRLVLLESVTNFFVLIATYLCINLILKDKITLSNQIKYYLAIVSSMILAFLTKPLAVPSLVTLFFLPLFLSFRKKAFTRLYLPLLIGMMLMAILFIPVKSKFLYYVNMAVPSPEQIFLAFKLNLWKSWWWLKVYLTVPVILFLIMSSVLSLIGKEKKIVWFVLYWAIMILLDAFFSKLLYPRHLYSLVVPTSFIIAFGIYRISQFKKIFLIPLIFLILFLPWKQDYLLLTNPIKALTLEDKQAFYEDSYSGAGLDKMAQKLYQLSQGHPIEVFVENEAIVAWTLTNLYDVGNAKIHPNDDLVSSQDTIRNKFYAHLEKSKFENKVYILLSDHPYVPEDWRVSLVVAYPKGPNRTISLYEYQQ